MKPHPRLHRIVALCLSAALLSTLAVLSPIGPTSEAQGVVPFDCDGTPYIMQNGRMYQVVPDPANPGLFLFEEIGTGISYGNSLGYDPTTNLLYGVRKPGGVWTVETYDATLGVINSQPIVEAPGSPTYPSNGSNYAGTVLGDGRYIVGTYNAAVPGSTKDNLWSIDAATGLATWIGSITPQNPRMADMSYNPADGYLYHVSQGQVQRLDPLTGVKTFVGGVTGLTGSGYGSSYFDAAGNLYVHRNKDGYLYQVSGIGTGTHTASLVAITGKVSGADAASCVGEIDLLKDVVDADGESLALEDRVFAPGDTVRYEFTLINNALPSGPQDLTLCDVLPADGRTYTGAVISDAAISVLGPLAGETEFCLDVTVPSSLWTDPSQPGGDPVTVIIEVELGADMLPGEYENQATLESPFGGDPVRSDDPRDVTDPEDATTIQVTGEFTVTKSVAGHPDDNASDTFAIALTCTDSSGAAFDVAPTSIVDAAGDPWPGATVNTFAITHLDSVRVIDLPLDATCTAVEAPAPTAYAVTAVSSDVDVSNGGEITIDERPSEELVALVNETGTFTLNKQTSAPADVAAPLDLTGAFDVVVTCTLGGTTVLGPATYTIDATTLDGAGASGSAAWPTLPLVPAGASCTATEVVPPGWTSATGPVGFTISTATTATATFDNERLVATLDVAKTVTGLPDDEDPADFDFEVTVSCTGGFAAATETFGPFTLRTDLPVEVEGLPVGTQCEVVETPTQPFAPVYDPAGGLVTVSDSGGSVTIDNVTGTFVIEKNTTVDDANYPVDPTGDFSFDLVCTNDGVEIHNGTHVVNVTDTAPASGATGGITYGNGDLPLLPPGTSCVATETVPGGWALTSPNDVAIVVPADGVRPTATFENERVVADLTIAKDVVGLPPGVDPAAFSFDVEVTCDGPFTSSPVVRSGSIRTDAPFVLGSLPSGSRCAAVETPDPSFASTSAPDPAQADIDNANETITFTNETSWFSLDKVTSAPTTHPINLDETFSIDIVCSFGGDEILDTTRELTTVDGVATLAPVDIPLLPPGATCELTEDVPTGWTVAINPQTIETSAIPGAITFENRRDVGSLAITKQIEGLPVGADPADYSFTVDVLCTGDFDTGDGTYTIENLPITVAGATIDDLPTGASCIVTENPSSAFTPSYPGGNTAVITTAGATVDVRNTTSTFAIDKTTIVPAGVQNDGTFSFTWTCDDTAATTGTASITTTDGSGSLGFVDGLPLVVPGTTCSIDETALPSGWTVTASPRSVTTNSAAVSVAAFENRRATETLTVTKSIVGLPSGVDPTTFDFDIDITCTGDFESGPLELTDQPITTDTAVTVDNIPTGASCTVVEVADAQWTPLYDPVGGEIIISADTKDVSIVNSTGELIIFKENVVESDRPIDPTGDFDFHIRCIAPGDVVAFDNVMTMTVDTLTVSGAIGGIRYDELGVTFAPDTVCTVTEQTPPSGWSILSTNPVDITISPDGGETAEFVNGRDLGDLTLTKTIEGLPADVDPATFSFSVTVVCNHDDLPTDYTMGPVTIRPGTDTVLAELPTGASCVATEAADSRFTPTLPADPTVIADAAGATLPILNTTRVLSITKAATAVSGDIDLRGTFTFEVVCTNGVSTTVNIATDVTGNGSIAYPGLPLLADGTDCTVTEQGPPTGWTLTSPNGVTASMDSDQTIAFTNERDVASLDITKSIIGLPALANPADYAFTVDVSCAGGFDDDTLTFDNVVLTAAGTTIPDLPTGATCTVTEDPTSAFVPGYPSGTARLITDGANTIPVTNTTSTFEITKSTLVPDGVEDDGSFSFAWVCDDPAGSSGSGSVTTADGSGGLDFDDALPLVPPGTSCTITETALPAGWEALENPIVVTTSSGGIATADFVNVRSTADLTVTKTILGFPDGFSPSLDDEAFPITVTCTGDFEPNPAEFGASISVNTPAVISDLPTGADCAVVEDDDPRFFAMYDPASTVISAGGSQIDVTNATGELLVRKVTVVDTERPIDPLGTFEFQITCTGPGGAIVFDAIRTVDVDTVAGGGAIGGIRYDSLPLFADGTVCTVEEVNVPDGWTNTSTENPVTVTIDSDAPATAGFENTRDLGQLTVTKTVEGLPAGIDPATFSFVVSVICNHDDLPADYTIGPLSIQPGTDVVIDELPTGAICRAAEEADPRFTPTLPAPATIATDGTSLDIVNTTSTFALTKTATTTSALPIDLVETFDFEVDCGAAGTATIEITTTADGSGRADHADGVPLVAPGTTCAVTELTPPVHWTVASTNPAPITTSPTETVELGFTNTRDLANLSVDKVVEGLPDSLDEDDFDFLIDITCSGGFATADGTYTQIAMPLSTAATTRLDDLPAGTRCTVTETPDSIFATDYDPAGGIADLDTDTTVTVTNTTTHFAIDKTTVAPAAAENDGTFGFSWSCDDPASSAGTATVTTIDGSGSFEFDDGLPLLAPGTTCVIDEDTLPAGWTPAETPLTITTTPATIATANFVNTRDSADLTISKTVLGLDPVDPPAESYTFTVDITCIGDFPGGSRTLLDQPLTSVTPLIVPDIPTGAVCTVIEDPHPQFAALYGPEDGTVTVGDAGAGVAVNNLTGRVSFAKQTIVPSDKPIDPVDTFAFQIECLAVGGAPVLFADTIEITTDTITAAGAIGIPDEADFPLLPAGTDCTITELGPDNGWILTSVDNPVTVIIDPDPNPGSFVNTRDVADLEIAKTIVGLPAGVDPTDFRFEVTTVCNSPDLPTNFTIGPLLIGTNFPARIGALPTGATCSVNEAADSRFAAAYSDASVTIDPLGAVVEITNTTSSLTVNKTAEAPGTLPIALGATFTFDLTCDNGLDTTVSITTDETGVGSVGYPDIALIASGSGCVVTEPSPPAGWSVVTDTTDLTLTGGETTVGFLNTRDVGDLRVSKIVEGTPPGVNLDDEQFDITISCAGGFVGGTYDTSGVVSVNSPYGLADVPTGTECSVAEAPDPRFSTSYDPGTPTVTVTVDGADVEITNATGELIVSKQTSVAADHPIDPTGTFRFEIICRDPVDGQIVFDGIRDIVAADVSGPGATGGVRYSDLPLMPDGTICTVTELDLPPGWNLTSPNGQQVVIDSAEPATAAFTNTRQVGSLDINKVLEGLPIGARGKFDDELFSVTLSCIGDFVDSPYVFERAVSVNAPIAIPNLPTGATCTITETDDPRFTPSYAPRIVTVDADGTSATITNTSGELIFLKETVVESTHPIIPVEPFEFRVVCVGPAGNTVFDAIRFVEPATTTQTGAIGGIRYDDLPLLADGTVCTISEQNLPDQWVLETPNDVEVTIDQTSPETAHFVNAHETGDLLITKETVGLPAGVTPDAFDFEVTVVCNHPNLTPDYVIGPLAISGNGSVEVLALPTGANCVVTETPDPRFRPVYSPDGATVTVPRNGTVTVGIRNEAAEFALVKRTTIAPAHPVDPTGNFDFAIVCIAPDGAVVHDHVHTVTVNALTATGAIGMLGYGELPLLGAGTTCTATETNIPAGWSVVGEPAQSIVIDSDGPRSFDFENQRDRGSLTIAKTIEGLPDAADQRDFSFAVNVTCNGAGLPADYTLPTVHLVPGTTEIIADIPTLAECVVSEQPDLGFSPLYAPAALATISSADEIVAVEIVNRTGVLTIEKQATRRSGTFGSVEATFEFAIECSNGYRGTHTVTTNTDGLGSTTWPDIPLIGTGTECTITEQPSDGWDNLSGSVLTHTMTTGENAATTFVNQRQAGAIVGVLLPPEDDAAQPVDGPDPAAVAQGSSTDSAAEGGARLALTGSSARDLAAGAFLLLALGFFSAGIARRRREDMTPT